METRPLEEPRELKTRCCKGVLFNISLLSRDLQSCSKNRSLLVDMMSTEKTIESDHDSAEVCIRRLSRKLSEVEIVMAAQEGKANQMKKERDAERTENEQLKKEVRRLNNELLKERTIAVLTKRNCSKEQNDKEVTDGNQEGGCDFEFCQTRRGSLPVASLWRQTQRRGSQDFPKDIRKLLERRSNELLQQRQQYRIFEYRFKQQADRCIKLDSDLERLNHLLVKLLGLHGKCHGCSVFWHDNIVMLGKKIKLHCTTFILSSIAVMLVALFIFLALEN